jgi:hypothetical protein
MSEKWFGKGRMAGLVAGLLALGGLCFSSVAKAKGYAVLVGIGKYRLRGISNLSGPPHDVQKMKRLLQNTYKFSQVKVLLNEQATKAKIVEALKWLARTAKKNDYAVFYFSGHGSRVNDAGNDEPDGLDETLVPYDVGPNRESHIIDDEIAAWMRTVRSRRLTIIFDSCHSGTGTKGLGLKYWSNPYLKPVKQKKALNTKSSGFRAIRVQVRTRVSVEISMQWQVRWGLVTPTAPHRPRPQRKPRFLFLAASLSNQFAYDVGRPTDSVLTHYLLEGLSRKPRQSVSQLVSYINGKIRGTWQMTPNAEGATNEPLFFYAGRVTRPQRRPPEPPRTSAYRCYKGFCARFRLLNKRGRHANRFRNHEEIRFLFKLNKPGYVAILNVDANGKKSIIFPDLYYRTLGSNKRTYRVGRRKWYLLPPGGGGSRAYFKVVGKPGSREYVELIAVRKRKHFRALLKKKLSVSKRIVVVTRLRKKPSVVRARLYYYIKK